MDQKLLVGMSQKDITPPARVSLQGQFHTRISEYVESPLLANVFAAESAGDQIVICACDLVGIGLDFANTVRAKIRERCPDLDADKVIFSATHTHTGPEYYRVEKSLHVAAKFLPEEIKFVDYEKIPDDVWMQDKCGPFIADRLCEAVCEAWEKRQPGQISPSFGRAVVGHCRRVVYDDASAKMYGSTDTVNFEALEGGNDSGIELLYVFDAANKPVGALANVACPSQCVEGEYYISADYWGKARDKVKAQLGDDFILVGLCGAGGDQSPRDLVRRNAKKQRRSDPNMHGLEGAIELGDRVARVVLDKLESAAAEPSGQAVIAHEVLSIDFPLRRVTISEYDNAKRQFMDYVRSNPKTTYDSRDMSALHIHGGIMERYEKQQTVQFYTSEIHVARIGDIAITTNPFELFLDYGNKIKAMSEATQTFVIQLACDTAGYLPTAKAERGSHYSAYVSSGKTGHDGGELLVRKTLDTIQKLWQE